MCEPIFSAIVKAAARTGARVGKASGTVYGASSLGSIVGTFLTTYWMVERLGSKGTLFMTGAVLSGLAVAGYVIIGSRRRWWQGVLPGMACLLAPLLGFGPNRTLRPGPDLLCERESRYQYLRVRRDSAGNGTVLLGVDACLDSFQSIYLPGKVLTGGQYYDYFALLPALAGMTHPRNVCIVGFAAGTTARIYDRFFGSSPGFHMEGVEIDPGTVELGRRFMGLGEVREEHLSIHTNTDGRVFLRSCGDRFDVIVVDAYTRQIFIPFHLATREFFEVVRRHLAPGGIFGMNVGGFFHEDALLGAVARTAASVFGSVAVARIPRARNFMVFAQRDGGYVDPRSIHLPEDMKALASCLEEIARFGVTRRVEADPGALILTDDLAPLASLCRRDLGRIGRRILFSEGP